MKSNLKKLAALLLTAVLVLSLFPTTSFAANGIKKEKLTQDNSLGYIHTEIPGGHYLTDAYLRGEAAETNATRTALPSKYDSRDYGYIPAVRNQNPYGTCWAHGAIAAIEAYMIKHGVINEATGQPADTSINLSEYHLAWFNYTNAYDKLGMLTGDSSAAVGDNFLNRGGNKSMATYTLMRWAGPASETTSALKYSKASTTGLSAEYAYAYNVAHVSDVTWIPLSNRDEVKRSIMEYGAGGISYYHEDYYYNSATAAYCAIQTASQYGNHAVTLVGWDDNYPQENFKSSSRPENDGAWIIRNSWDSTWGEDGYFYLSYEDSASLNEECSFFTVEEVDNYNNCYQYDGTASVSSYEFVRNNGQIANVFQANSREQLRAVSLAFNTEATSYTVRIYKNPTTGNPTSGTLMTTQDGYFAVPGYHTIARNDPIKLAAGDTFSVVLHGQNGIRPVLKHGNGDPAILGGVFYGISQKVEKGAFKEPHVGLGLKGFHALV